jgi:beta-lactam-binding protein with PASTA domain
MKRSAFVALVLCACLCLAGCTVAAQNGVGTTPATPAQVVVPDLAGLDRTQAEAALTAASLTLGAVTEDYEATVAAGKVASQAPVSGAQAAKGSAVAILVSKGPESVAIPDVIGKTKTDATQLLEATGFQVKSQDKNNKARKGTVIAQKPAKGTVRDVGTTVTITVSTGIVMVRVPNIRGMIDADAALKKVGLKGKGTPVHGPIESDCAGYMEAYRQHPAAGTLVPKGTTVTYRYWWEYQ